MTHITEMQEFLILSIYLGALSSAEVHLAVCCSVLAGAILGFLTAFWLFRKRKS